MLKIWKGFLVTMFASMLILAGCSSKSGGNKDEYHIGISVYADHPSLNAATDGFKKALADQGLKVKFNEQNAQGDTNTAKTAAQNLVNAKVDLIFANATPSAVAAAGATKQNKIPVIFTSVTDPVGAKLVESMEKPGGNVTGTTDTHPDAIPNTIKFIQDYIPATKIGTIYNAGEQNSVVQIDAMKKALNNTGITLVEKAIANTSEVKQAAESLVGNVDVIYIITDNSVVEGLESVISVAQNNDIPLFVGELDSVKRGGFAAYGFDYYDIGYEAGLLAAQILKDGKDPSELAAQYPQKLKLLINKKAASEMGIELNSEWDDIADYHE